MTATCSTAPEDDVRRRRSWALSERTAQRTLQQLLRQQQNLLDGGARGGKNYQNICAPVRFYPRLWLFPGFV